MFKEAASLTDRKNIKAFIQGHIRAIKKAHNTLPSHIVEQAAWRLSVADKECLKNDQCKSCGCFPMADKVLEDRGCISNGCYPNMMSAEQWEDYKVFKNIKI